MTCVALFTVTLVPLRHRAVARAGSSSSASCRASAAAAWGRASRRSWPTPSRPPSAAWPSPSTAWRSCSRPPSGRRSAASSPTTSTGAGSSSSTCPVGLLSLFLSNRIVTDPPHLEAAKEQIGRRSTASGWASSRRASGALEVVLDKGQEDDWFHSHVHHRASRSSRRCALVSFVVLGAAARAPHRRPAACSSAGASRSPTCMMLMLGIALFGSTVLLPQYLQVLMGYTAQQSGMALSPGGFAHHPAAAARRASSSRRVDARMHDRASASWCSARRCFYMARNIDHADGLQDGRRAARASSRWAWRSCSCPSTRSSYAGVPPEKNNQVSGIMNLSRNMGGDIGIAFVTTLIARRSQAHQALLQSHDDAATIRSSRRSSSRSRTRSSTRAPRRSRPRTRRRRCSTASSSCSRRSSRTSTRSGSWGSWRRAWCRSCGSRRSRWRAGAPAGAH